MTQAVCSPPRRQRRISTPYSAQSKPLQSSSRSPIQARAAAAAAATRPSPPIISSPAARIATPSSTPAPGFSPSTSQASSGAKTMVPPGLRMEPCVAEVKNSAPAVSRKYGAPPSRVSAAARPGVAPPKPIRSNMARYSGPDTP